MIKKLALTACLLASATPALASVQAKEYKIAEGEKLSSFIIGGGAADLNEYKFYARIAFMSDQDRTNGIYRQVCGASILNNKFIVTAAHCVDSDALSEHSYDQSAIKVITDSYDLTSTYFSDFRNVKSVHIHPDWRTDNLYKGDIAVLELETEINTPYATPFYDELDPNIYNSLSTFEAIGLGLDSQGDRDVIGDETSPTALKHTELLSKADGTCNILQKYPESTICVGILNSSQVCNGDSGGPLFYKGNQGYVQIGLTSYGNNICMDGDAVFTELSYYKTWMEGIAGSFGGSIDSPDNGNTTDENSDSGSGGSGGSFGWVSVLALLPLTLRRKLKK